MNSRSIPERTDAEIAQEGRLVRPYALTGGRTRSDAFDLAIEALVMRTGAKVVLGLSSHQQELLDRSERALSLAELAAYSRLPIGVTRVLVGDLCAEGAMRVVAHGLGSAPEIASELTNASESEAPMRLGATNIDLLERVLNGLRAL
jgi:hypothetical protein